MSCTEDRPVARLSRISIPTRWTVGPASMGTCAARPPHFPLSNTRATICPSADRRIAPVPDHRRLSWTPVSFPEEIEHKHS